MKNAARSAGLPAHELVYRRLRDLILFGELVPGQPVTIQGLVETLQAGMTPVREALRRLTAEGALDAGDNRRIMVPVLSPAALAELTEARLTLEPLLAEQAAQRATASDIEHLRRIDDALDAAIQRGDLRSYLAGNHQFHQRLNAVAEKPILTALVEGLWLRFGPSLRVVCGQMGTRSLPDRHKDILTALAQQNGVGAAQAMRADIAQGMALIRQGAPAPGPSRLQPETSDSIDRS